MFYYFTVLLAIFITSSNCTLCTTDTNSSLTNEEINKIMSEIKDYLPVLTTDNNLFDFNAATADYKLASQKEDLQLNMTQLIEKNGHTAEQHEITTSDGYILNFFRIVGKGPAILCMCGLLSSSYEHIIREDGLAFTLANEGYDVWLGNPRGNEFGRRHINLSPNCAEFWDFCWHDIGVIDVPETIDYILKTTKQSKLNYIGHSQGATNFFVMCSERPEYNDKISLAILLSPVCWLTKLRGPATLFGSVAPGATFITSLIGNFEIFGRNALTEAISDYVCETPEKAAIFCNNILFLTTSFNYPQVNASYLPMFFAHVPAGSSIKQFIHYAQLIQSKKFRQYNYGIIENIQRYGSDDPPDYPVDKVTARTVLFNAEQDYVSSWTDVNILAEKLPNLVEIYRVSDKLFGHLDYILAKDAVSLVHNKILSYLRQKSSF